MRFQQKNKCNSILKNWHMTFQALNYKRKNFLDLNNDDHSLAKLTYLKGETWLYLIGHSNTLCIHVIRAIMNHAPISEYCLRFFPNEFFACLYEEYPIETRNHILNCCRWFRNY